MKKVLVITYYWPPAGGPGVQRWLNFVKYLPKFDVTPVVYIPKNPTYPIVDQNLVEEITEHIEIISNPIFEPYAFAKKLSKKGSDQMSKGIFPEKKQQSTIQKIMLWVRGNCFIPDARKYWVKPSVRFLKKYIQEKKIETVITTGPPHSLHLIGLYLKKQLNINWIADFRDPWTSIGYHHKLKLTSFSKKKHLDLEKQVLQNASKVIVTSWKTKKEFESITSNPIKVITNGFEPINFAQKIQRDQKFTISHIGSLLSERNPKNFWKVLSDLIKENTDFANKFQLNLAGVVSDEVLKSIEEEGLKSNLNLIGYVSHQKALELQHKTQVLLLVEINKEITKAIIPGKLFEYLQAKRPIIAIGPNNADYERVIKETESGNCFQYNSYKDLKSKIIHYFELYQQNKLHINSKGVEKYTRKNLTQQLAKTLKEM